MKFKNAMIATAALAAATSGVAAPALAATTAPTPITVTPPAPQAQSHTYGHITPSQKTKAKAQADVNSFLSKIKASKGKYVVSSVANATLTASGWQGEVIYKTTSAPLASSDIDLVKNPLVMLSSATGTHYVKSVGTERQAKAHLAWAVRHIKSQPNKFVLIRDANGHVGSVFKNTDGTYGYSVSYHTGFGGAFKGDWITAVA